MNLSKPSYLLTFEWDSEAETLEIHGNKKGLENLKRILDFLLSNPTNEHAHLMTKDWGGKDLSDEKQNPTNEIINHVKVFKWLDN